MNVEVTVVPQCHVEVSQTASLMSRRAGQAAIGIGCWLVPVVDVGLSSSLRGRRLAQSTTCVGWHDAIGQRWRPRPGLMSPPPASEPSRSAFSVGIGHRRHGPAQRGRRLYKAITSNTRSPEFVERALKRCSTEYRQTIREPDGLAREGGPGV